MMRTHSIARAAVLSLAMAAASQASAQSGGHQQSSSSVVEITCTMSTDGKSGQMRATGFVWPQPGYVVTALHAVQGCDTVPYVKSEAKKDGSPARIQNRHLESDLALLKMDRDLGLNALKAVTSIPNPEDRFFLYGYPQFARSMDGGILMFKWGIGGTPVTTLDRAFRDTDLTALLNGQSFPTADTQILKIESPIKSGHSGSPVFDAEGRVVAIVDGALLDGVSGANWSIPASIYLEELRTSQDVYRGGVSAWAQKVLRSSITPDESIEVIVPTATALPRSAATQAPGVLQLVRRITMGEIGESIRDDQREDYQLHWDNLNLFLENPDAVDALTFNVYEEPNTGATIALPAHIQPVWDADSNGILATAPSGRVYYYAYLAQAPSFENAIGASTQAFLDVVAGDLDWGAEDGSPRAFELENCVTDFDTGGCDPDWPWRQNAWVYDGRDPNTAAKVELTLSVEVSETVVMGEAMFNTGDFNDDLTFEDKVDYLQMQAGIKMLNRLSPL